MTRADFQNLAPSIPRLPGVYHFISGEGEILYVGKAKSLRNRLASYFSESSKTPFKVRSLRRHAAKIEYTIVDTEQDALLLENTMIKRFQPRYNVMLKDGKTYVYIQITKERFPRVLFTRRVVKDGSIYFGPYTSKHRANMLLELIKTLFPLRTCNYNLSEDNIQKGKIKLCLEYHIKNCAGPCVGYEKEEQYMEKIRQIKNILKGKFRSVKEFVKQKMQEAADNLQFEQAAEWKERLEVFKDYQSKSTVVSTQVGDVDVFSIEADEDIAYVNYLMVKDGAIINSYTAELEMNLDRHPEDVLTYAIHEIREKYDSLNREIIVPYPVPLFDDELKCTVPKRGDKLKLLELSQKNVRYFHLQTQKHKASKTQKKNSTQRILNTLQSDLRMPHLPMHIECFDNSNIQGTHPVASCVVFKAAKPSKKDYRHFHIRTVEGPNDFASMEEIVYRRYKRLLDEKHSLPQLVVIDGGKGQLSAAMKSIAKLGLTGQMTIIGIAKRLEEIFFPGDRFPLYIDKKSESLKLLQQVRNEAHRFAISFHRDIRSKFFLQTQLTDIPGIGHIISQNLLSLFGSVQRIQNLPFDELKASIGPDKALRIYRYFHPEEEEE